MTRLRMWEWLGRLRSADVNGAEEPAPPLGGRSLHSLVVTADGPLGEQLTNLLEDRNHHHVACRNVRSAVNTIKIRHPDLALIDWSLPGHGARQLAKMLSRTTLDGRCQVLALVSGDGGKDVQEALLDGIDDYLVMPVDDQELHARLTLAEVRILEHDALLAAQQDLQLAHERFLIASAGTEDGIWDWCVASGTIDFSPRWYSMLGYREHEVGGSPEAWFDLVHGDDRAELQLRLEDLISGVDDRFEHRYRLRRRDGTYCWVLVRAEAVRDQDRRATRIVGRQGVITDPAEESTEVSLDRFHDPLTRLPNRALLLTRLQQTFSLRSGDDEAPAFAVLFFDLDRFRTVNDSLGHIAGDKLLCAIARRIEDACHPQDTVGRFGGDEFVVVAESISDIRDATRVAESFRTQLSQPFAVDGVEVFTTTSIGIAMCNPSCQSPEDLLREADTAMYRAKKRGGNCSVVFDEKMHTAVVQTLRTQNDLCRALARGELCAYYQPIISLDGGLIIGFEALVRWQHPERGLLAPGEFVKVAEEAGLIIRIDRQIALEACSMLRHWQVSFRQAPPLKISVNISTVQFMQPDIISQIDHILRKTGLYGNSLTLEVTESAVMEDTSYTSDMFKQLRALNIGISIDDFGTGYSSLAYLRRFEADTIKIDRSFVSRMLVSEESLEIVRSIAHLAKNLGKQTVAEGVETVAQLESLRGMGIDCIQGYLVSRPLPAEEAEKLLARSAAAPNPLHMILEDRTASRAAEQAPLREESKG